MFSGQSVADWLRENIIIVEIIILSISLFWAANSGKTREFMLKLGLGIFAMAFLAIALNYEAVGEWIRGILGA
ncbi:hypothetical protein VBH63_11470 [Kocuria rhizophila]|uniref:hypothetical protein n=1 Tax=Kocuria TaxID=57493 RepID=UPI00073D3168|nr:MULTISPECIES: hypothetical protein [Kocuria]MDN5700876.1 hypothetical protein [Kocuria sp.]OBA45704.1 hypothetical protein A5728_00280 [Kocuria sp. ICS0012]